MGTKQTQKVAPYDPAAIKAGQTALDTGYGATQASLAKYSPALDAAIGQIGKNIAAPPAYLTDARGQLDHTINGQYLDPASNPYAGGMADLIAKRTGGQYNQTFGASGRAHGGLASMLSGQGVADALGSFYGGIYENERGRQQQATFAAPSFHQDEYTDANNLIPAVSNVSMMPLGAANTYASGMGNLIAPYTTTTQKQSGLGTILGPALGLDRKSVV